MKYCEKHGEPLSEDGICGKCEAEKRENLADDQERKNRHRSLNEYNEKKKGNVIISFFVILIIIAGVGTGGYFGVNAIWYARHSAEEKVIIDMTRVLKKNPNNTSALDKRGAAYCATNELKNAAADYTALVKLDPAYAAVLTERGDKYFTDADYPKAIVCYDTLISAGLAGAQVYLNRGFIFLNTENTGKAVQDFEIAHSKDPQISETMKRMSDAYIAKNAYEQALTLLNLLIQWDNNDTDAHLKRADIYFAQKNYTDAAADYLLADRDQNSSEILKHAAAFEGVGAYTLAIPFYTKLLISDENNVDAIILRGDAYRNAGDADAAAKDYSRAAPLLKTRAAANLKAKDYAAAVADYSKIVSFDLADAEVYKNRAEAYLNLAQYNNARQDFASALKLDPSFISVFKDRAEKEFKNAAYDAAISLYSAILDVKPEDSVTLLARADAYSQKKEFDNAMNDYSAYIKQKSYDTKVINKMAQAYMDKRMYKNAAWLYEVISEMKPADRDARINRGIAYTLAKKPWLSGSANFKNDIIISVTLSEDAMKQIEAKNYSEAIKLLDTAIKSNNCDPWFYYWRGIAYTGKGDSAFIIFQGGEYKNAVTDFTGAIGIDPDIALFYTARAQVYERQKNYNQAIIDCDTALRLVQDSKADSDKLLEYKRQLMLKQNG